MPERLALIAGTGALVPEVIAAARRKGFELKLLTLGRRRDQAGLEATAFSLSHPEGAVEVIRNFGATCFAMAGGVSLSDIARERLAGFFSGADARQSIGDTGISDLVARLEAMTGARPMGVHEIAPELLAPEGLIGGPELNAAQRDAAVHALVLARKAGVLDLGQAIVIAGKRAIAVEDISGTDALLKRVRKLRRLGLAADGTSPLVLAKCAKPDQPLFVDLPAIGPLTVENARKSGVSVIAVQAGRTLLIQREQIRATAGRLGVSVVGLVVGG